MVNANLVIDLLFLIDTLANFRTSFTNPMTGDEVLEPKKIARHYIGGTFWIDFFSVLPLELILGSFFND